MTSCWPRAYHMASQIAPLSCEVDLRSSVDRATSPSKSYPVPLTRSNIRTSMSTVPTHTNYGCCLHTHQMSVCVLHESVECKCVCHCMQPAVAMATSGERATYINTHQMMTYYITERRMQVCMLLHTSCCCYGNITRGRQYMEHGSRCE